MEVTYIVMSFYLCCVFFSLGAHHKVVKVLVLKYSYISPVLAVNTVTGNSISISYHSGLSSQFGFLSPLSLVEDQGEYSWLRLDTFKLTQSIPRVFRGRRFKG